MGSDRARLRLVAVEGRRFDNEEPLFLHSFVPGRTLADNAFSIARPLFGKVWAEWAMCLAIDVVDTFPDADRGRQKRGWAGGILWALAVRRKMFEDRDLGREVIGDIVVLTGASTGTAFRRLTQLRAAGLDRPRRQAPRFS